MLTIKKALVKKIVLWVAAVFLVFSLVGFFVAPPVIRHYAIKHLSRFLERDVTIDKISLNPYTLSLTVRGFSVQEKGGKGAFVSFKELYLDALSLSMVKEGIIFEQIRLNDPYVKIDRNNDNSYNFSDIIEKATTPPAVQTGETQKKSKPYKFSFNKISISNGSIDFWDGPNNKKHEVREFSLKVPFLSTLKRHAESDVKPSLSAKINGTPYAIEGKTRPFSDSLETSFDIRFTGLNVPYYLAYIPAKMNFSIPSGNFDAKIAFVFTQHKDKPSRITLSGEMALKDLVVNDIGKKPLAKVPLMEVKIVSVEPLTGVVHLARVAVNSPEFYLSRSRAGTLNVEELYQTKKPGSPPKKTKEAVKPSPEKEQTGKLPVLAVDALEITDGKIVFRDTTPTGPVMIQTEKILLRAENITTEKRKRSTFKLDLVLNKRGTVAITGEAGIDPLSITAKTVLKNIGIVAFQPYFADKVRVDITNGRLNVDGDVTLLKHENRDLSARFKGKTSVTRFASVDLDAAKDFLKWDSLYITNIDAGINPTSFTVKGVSLSNYFAHIIIHPDKTSNLQDIFVTEKKTVTENTADEPLSKKTEETEKKKDDPIPIKIDRVTLQGGNVRFEDLSVRPQFKLNMSKLGGRVTGLSSAVNTTAEVDLKGTVGEYAPLEIEGRINPLKKDLYVDLKASMKGLELSPASTYSGKYLGYTIEKGTLSFDVEYKVDNRKLDSKHNVFLDQFTFGESVDSPDATKLPVRLAVALLKDRRGEIKLEIPVTGSLDDPQFSVWRIVIKILFNLLAKAATAPFALLGALFGGGEELGYVEFDPGSDVLSEANGKKIAALTKALNDRPSLKLDIAGHADLEKDREGIKRVTMTRKIKAQKLKDIARKGISSPSIDDVTIDPREYEKYLRRAYSAERFSKPRNIVGLQKTLPVTEMEKLMTTNVQVKEEDLRGLAAQRAIKVKEALLKAGVDPGRVFVLDIKTIAPEKKEKLKDSRVDFTLK